MINKLPHKSLKAILDAVFGKAVLEVVFGNNYEASFIFLTMVVLWLLGYISPRQPIGVTDKNKEDADIDEDQLKRNLEA